MNRSRILGHRIVRGALRYAMAKRTERRSYSTIWIDVGAHAGETTLQYAAARPRLLVYAFEPNLRAAARIMGRLANYVVLPIAITEENGSAPLNLASYEQSSSLLPFDTEGLAKWKEAKEVHTVDQVSVPTMRLDTFLNAVGIARVDFLKIDAQGTDLQVARSLGNRIRDVHRIQIEATNPGHRQYSGAADRNEISAFLTANGFQLALEEEQSHRQEVNLTFTLR